MFVAFGRGAGCLDATADLQVHLGRKSAAMATSEQINGEELPEEERKELLRGNHLRLARLHRSRQDKALWHLDQALKLGTPPQGLREDNELGELRNRPSFNDLLKRYE